MIFSNSIRRAGGLAQAGADHDAIEPFRLKRCRCHHLGSIAKIDQAAVHVVSERPKLLDLRIDVAADDFRRELWKGREVGKRRVDADCEHAPFRHRDPPGRSQLKQQNLEQSGRLPPFRKRANLMASSFNVAPFAGDDPTRSACPERCSPYESGLHR
jgi:hypothetical protein